MSDYTPITGELRELLADINWTEILDHVHTNGGGICDGDWLDHWHEQAERLCDAIDAVHAQLEEENERLQREMDERPIAVGADAAKTMARLERENAALKAERDEGLPEQVDAKVRHIPDELRLYANQVGLGADVAEKLNAIADRIETSCRTLAANQWMRGIKYAHSDDGLREYGLVSLPVDADGVPIHVGDMLAGEKAGGFGLCDPFEVGSIVFYKDGITAVYDSRNLGRCAEFAHHYQPDTWERIIADACGGTASEQSLVARCKALAGDAE